MNPCMYCPDRYPCCQSLCPNPEHIEYDRKAKAARDAIARTKTELCALNLYKTEAMSRRNRQSNLRAK